MVKNVGDLGSIPGLGRSSGIGKDNLLQYSCLGNWWTEEPGGYSPWGCKQSDMTEQLMLAHFFPRYILWNSIKKKFIFKGTLVCAKPLGEH